MLIRVQECLRLKNYSSLAAIVWSLGHVSIQRLKRTWAQVPKKSLKALAELRELTSVLQNFGNLRAKIESESPPLIPNFGMQFDIQCTERRTHTCTE
jgi:son of sevenless